MEIADENLRALLAKSGVQEIKAGSVLAIASARDAPRRGWTIALERASHCTLDAALTDWIRTGLQRLATEEASDKTRACAAEIEAALRLSWIGPVVHVAEQKKKPTCDFRIEPFNVEVYCPQQHVEERRVIEADLAAQLSAATAPFAVAIATGRPSTGSGRKVDREGRVVRDSASQAASFLANKVIDRLLSDKKRQGIQFVKDESNILWLDLKHGLELTAVDCMPLRSCVSKGMCFVGMNGVWHAFYGRKGDPLFTERAVLEYPVPRVTYQQQREGWFRECPQASCAILSVLDGLVRLDNPWAAVPMTPTAAERLTSLSEFRPEFSWFDERAHTLETRIEAERQRLAWLAQPKATPP